MTTETVLTDAQIIGILEENRPEHDGLDNAIAVSRAIEQAVLQSPEIQALRNQDPLQGAANWFVEAITNCDVTDIQYHLIIGYNRAKRLFDAAMEQQT